MCSFNFDAGYNKASLHSMGDDILCKKDIAQGGFHFLFLRYAIGSVGVHHCINYVGSMTSTQCRT